MENPFQPADDGRLAPVAVMVEYLYVDDICARGHTHKLSARAGPVAGNRARDVGSMPAGVRTSGITWAGEAHRRQNTIRSVGQVGIAGDAGVEHGHRHAAA